MAMLVVAADDSVMPQTRSTSRSSGSSAERGASWPDQVDLPTGWLPGRGGRAHTRPRGTFRARADRQESSSPAPASTASRRVARTCAAAAPRDGHGPVPHGHRPVRSRWPATEPFREGDVWYSAP